MERRTLQRQLYDHVREDCDTGFFEIKDSGFLYFDQAVALLASSMPPFVKEKQTHARAELLFYLHKHHPIFCYLEGGVVLFLVGYSPMAQQPHNYELVPLVFESTLPSEFYHTFFLEWIEERIISLQGHTTFHVFVTRNDETPPPMKAILFRHGYQIIEKEVGYQHQMDYQMETVSKRLCSSIQSIQ